MNKTEVFNEITTPLKWYQGYCTSSYATQIKQKFKAGTLGEKAIQRLFKHFGYTIKKQEEWERK